MLSAIMIVSATLQKFGVPDDAAYNNTLCALRPCVGDERFARTSDDAMLYILNIML